MLREEMRMLGYGTRYSLLQPGEQIQPYQLTRHSALSGPSSWLFVLSIGLGLALGVVHFWIPHFTRTWHFLLHRSLGRMSILGAKLTAAAIGFAVCLGAVWTVLYWYACRPGVFLTPAPARVFVSGWVFVVLGILVYLATALTGLTRARWYTTKIFPLAFATIVLFAATVHDSLFRACVLIALSIVVLLSQVVNTFLKREF